MKKYFQVRVPLVVSCLLLVVSILSGCGDKTESSHYFYSPEWTRDGRIIMLGSSQTTQKDSLGDIMNTTYAQYFLTMYPSGTGETGTLIDVTNELPAFISCSPTGDYVAYLNGKQNGLYRKIIIRNIGTATHVGLNNIEIAFDPGIVCFDWSNNGSKLVYCTAQEIRTRDWNDFLGTTDKLITTEANISFVAWKYGDRIAFVYSSGGSKLLSLITPDGLTRTDQPANLALDRPQISPFDNDDIYGVAGAYYARLDVSAGTVTNLAANFTGDLPRLSPDGRSAVYSKTNEDSGVYLLKDVTTAAPTETKIK